jgi:DNA polymerase III gamma/tau subunit
MNFLNACTVAKTCRDGKAILAFPDSMYQEVVKIAKATDGHRLLRVMEIFAKVETELKYSTSQRILFETAVLKAAMPQEDYDIESLIARIVSLENQLANGVVVQNEGGRVEMNAKPAPVAPPVKPVETPKAEPVKAVEEIPPMEDFYIPPDEDQTGGNVYFDGFAPKAAPKKEEVKPAPTAPTPIKTAKPVAVGEHKATFGTFLRTIRKIARNGILLTLCMDLDGEYDGDVFVLYTTSDTIYRSLTKPDHYAAISQAFADMGLEDGQFAVRLRGKQSDDFQKSVNEIKSTFEGVKIDIK